MPTSALQLQQSVTETTITASGETDIYENTNAAAMARLFIIDISGANSNSERLEIKRLHKILGGGYETFSSALNEIAFDNVLSPTLTAFAARGGLFDTNKRYYPHPMLASEPPHTLTDYASDWGGSDSTIASASQFHGGIIDIPPDHKLTANKAGATKDYTVRYLLYTVS